MLLSHRITIQPKYLVCGGPQTTYRLALPRSPYSSLLTMESYYPGYTNVVKRTDLLSHALQVCIRLETRFFFQRIETSHEPSESELNDTRRFKRSLSATRGVKYVCFNRFSLVAPWLIGCEPCKRAVNKVALQVKTFNNLFFFLLREAKWHFR